MSYSSADAPYVHRLVSELQRDGLNLWIDDPNLDKTKPSWKDDALRAIDDIYCRVVLFFVSKASLASRACLDELQRTESTQARLGHGNMDVPVIVVEVDPIDDMVQFLDKTYASIITDPRLTKEQKTEQVMAFSQFRGRWFCDNERVRIRSAYMPQRKGLIHADVAAEIAKLGIVPDDNVCGLIALTYLHRLQTDKARNALAKVIEKKYDDVDLMARAQDHYAHRRVQTALTYFLAAALDKGNPLAFSRAASCCMLLDHIDEGMSLLEISGSREAREVLNQLKSRTAPQRAAFLENYKKKFYGNS